MKCVWCKLVRYTERVHHVRDMQEFGHLLNPEKEQGAHDQTPRAGLKKPHGGGGYRGCGRREGQGGG